MKLKFSAISTLDGATQRLINGRSLTKTRNKTFDPILRQSPSCDSVK